jgi:predicted ArsR family transcriptional regulator
MSDKQASAERSAQIKKLEKKLSSRKKPWSIEELAEFFGVEGNTIRQWIRALGDKVKVSDAPKKTPGKGRPPKHYIIEKSDAPEAPVTPAADDSED